MSTTHALCLGPCRPAAHGGPRVVEPGSHLCFACTLHLADDLNAIASAWDDLTARLVSEGSGQAERVSGSTTPGLVINETTSNVMRDVTAWIWFVAKLVLDEREHSKAPADQGVPHLARWLADLHARWLSAHPDADLAAAFAVEAHDHARAVKRAAYPSGARIFPIGPCTETVTPDVGSAIPCPGKLYARISDAADVLPSSLQCDGEAHHSFAPHEWVALGRRLHRRVA